MTGETVLFEPSKAKADKLAINLRYEGYMHVQVSEHPSLKGWRITHGKKRVPRPFWTGAMARIFDGKKYYFQVNYPRNKRAAVKDAEETRKIGYLVRVTKEMNVPMAPQYVLWSRLPHWP